MGKSRSAVIHIEKFTKPKINSIDTCNITYFAHAKVGTFFKNAYEIIFHYLQSSPHIWTLLPAHFLQKFIHLNN